MATAQAEGFAEVLSSRLGISKSVIIAWVNCESGGGSQLAAPYNYLNLGNPSWSFPSNGAAVNAVYDEIMGGVNWEGIRRAIRTKDSNAIIEAIVESPWAEGHYGAPLITPQEVGPYGYPLRAYKASCINKSWEGDTGAIGGVKDATPFIPDAGQVLDPINQLIDIFKAIAHFFSILLQGATWVRIGEILGGSLLLVLAIRLANADIYGSKTTASSLVKSVAKVATTA